MIKDCSPIFRSACMLLVVVLLSSCSDDELLPLGKENAPEDGNPATEVNEANQHVNAWIQENMEYWYLWNEGLPVSSDKNAEPDEYFQSLLDDEDRFSWIQANYADLLNSLQGISREAGYEFVLYRDKDNDTNVILQITYVKPASPAAEARLKRGDIASHINGHQLTVSNYENLLPLLKANHSLRYRPIDDAGTSFGEPEEVSLATVEYAENPNYLHKIIRAGGKDIGYFVYNFFASGTESEPGKYDAGMDAVFGEFKREGIDELILDLRFNSGGSEAAARNLASLIGQNIDASAIFLKRQYNDVVNEAILNDQDLGADFLISRFRNKTNNIGSQLSSGRVYILTSSRTASASELVINALKPFMEVFLIGDVTYGKNVGSISLFEEKDPKNTWGMQPIVVKVYNSRDQSDYSQGFTPDIMNKDNSLFIYPLGDPRETLLSIAVAEITGTGSPARRKEDTRIAVGHSSDFKRRSFSLNMDETSIR